MPQIEYHCRKCDKRFERVVLLGEEETAPQCPACGSKDTGRSAASEPLFEGIASFSRLASDRD